jgi:hypothetical protein
MPHIRRSLRHLCYLTAAVGLIAGATPAWAAAPPAPPAPPSNPAHQIYTDPQPPSKADFTGHGANTHGAYDSTRSGAPSLNGNGKGQAIGKPCAGCVGKADNKNPPGQSPDGSDPNAGYECDRNHGVGRTNPAHTGCLPTAPSTGGSSSSGGGGSSSSSGGSSSSSAGSTSSGPSLGTSGVEASRPVTHHPTSGTLATTGTAIRPIVLAGLAMIALGLALLLGRVRLPSGKHT